ncbi:flagellar hook protein FlgE [Anaerosalibacter bizertensis]|uniref:Flagellar hook protein FlgE n=1 Tax=Anaerosalibacter bizertensis TaxID=932217 RepID=A0A9Q4FKU0_9FIRM|nr:flagellar hook protein FlgE [Anaerosalibacter bizertensis]MBV1816547.1 flagellar hook protein FlgE [Bacteroidales bacterium MSK.15.36]MCB5558649.1 flagellar hook protein FlgE [Anaerosalibacter bizertensis]MCG4563934.1 flagellar hook protein FlgE [Anaerosalibacter bizertensis]MCG4581941.1 flagellar hook protein FlgE [Anaerosalibacter bizertensis]MCG4584197.1 flagellar hook protein FlgE [Anaerosalibacter bizertensis]
MMRSMYSAVSGLRTHQTKMDVIGNNIANVNTVGYKKGQMTFQEVFSQIVRGAGAAQGGKGGTNPQQIGLGVDAGSINTIHTEGASQRTDNPTDVMIDGEGFFVVTDDTNFENRYYTRAGNFTVDGAGNLVTADGYKVLGYRANDNGEITETYGPIVINRSETIAATPTKTIELRGNLNPANAKHTTDTIIKDSLGNSWVVEFEFEKGTEENTWKMSLGNIKSQDGELEITNGELAETTIRFGEDGKIIADDLDLKLNIPSQNGASFGEDGDITIFGKDNPDSYNKMTQYANDTDLKPHAIDGNSSGKLTGFAIDPSGTVNGIFSNGENKALGQLMLAKFDNPMGLEKMGSNFFINTRNSGEPQYGTAGTSGFGAAKSGNLEMSNVDLSMEFTEMITTQRGFQANSRIITTSDEMLQELVNLKR